MKKLLEYAWGEMIKMLAVIRLRGTVKARDKEEDTLKLLRLHHRMHCVLLPETKDLLGMIQKAKDYITWGKISDEILEKLIGKRGRKPGDVRLNADEAKKIFSELKSNRKISELGVKPVFRLSPPSKGFKFSIKHPFPRGELGNRREKINELLERMI